MRLKLISTIVATQFLAAQVFASIPRQDRGISLDLNLVSSAYSQNGIDFSSMAQIRPDGLSSEDVSRLIPLDMPANSSTDLVVTHIADKSMHSFFNSRAFKSTNIGKTSHQVEQAMNQNVTIGGSAPNSIKHNFKFNMQATQQKASVDYTGYTNAQLSYIASTQEVNLEVFRAVTTNVKLAYNHIHNSTSQQDLVSLKIGF